MAAREPLRAVKVGQSAPEPARKRPKTLVQAIADGDERAFLVAQRTLLAKAMNRPKVSERNLSTLSKQVIDLTKAIALLDERASDESGSGDDDDHDDCGPADDEEFDPTAF